MTKIVKKRLQAVVALLVTMMIMIGIMPNEPFNTYVNAVAYRVWLDVTSSAGSPWGTAHSLYGTPWIEYNGAWAEMTPNTSNILGDGNTSWYYYESSSSSSSNIVISWNGINTASEAFSNGARYYINEASISESHPHLTHVNGYDTTVGGSTDPIDHSEVIGRGVMDATFYNYYYDQQVENNNVTVSHGQYKRPFAYFNTAVMLSDYGQNGNMYDGSALRTPTYDSDGKLDYYPTLYAGEFWSDPSGYSDATAALTDKRAGQSDRNNDNTMNWSSYYNKTVNGVSVNQKLSNFVWSANLADRLDGNCNHVSQMMIDKTISLDPSSSTYMVPTAGGYKLPYFDSDFLYGGNEFGKNLGKVYSVKYPFYQRQLSSAYTPVSGFSTIAAGTKMYTLDSDKDSVKVTSSGITENSSFVYDGNTATGGSRLKGFFPMNTPGDSEEELQFGFGTRFDIPFTIGKNGKDADGKNMIFTFTGDDDVWIFIDGELVLDMGGGHKKATGAIDFSKSTNNVAVNGAILKPTNTIATTSSNTTGARITTSSKVAEILAEANAAANGVSNEHMLTMYYMERGKINSNMSLAFNFVTPSITPVTEFESSMPTTETFKVREVTDFSGVNAGLVDLTKKVAEKDVFYYEVRNTSRADFVANGDAAYPSNGTFTRTNDEVSPAISNVVDSHTRDTTHLYVTFNDEADSIWQANNRNVFIWVFWNNDTGSALVKGTKVANVASYLSETDASNDWDKKLYQFTIDGTKAYNKIIVLLSKETSDANQLAEYNTSFTNGTTVNWSSKVEGKFSRKTKDFTTSTYGLGDTIVVGKDDGGDACKISLCDDVSPCLPVPDVYNFNPVGTDYVQNVSYLWTDDKVTPTSPELVGKTVPNSSNGGSGNGGAFALMYGTAGDESSATFKNQFDVGSYMNVMQSAQLLTTSGASAADLQAGTALWYGSPAVPRPTATYYTTTQVARNAQGATYTMFAGTTLVENAPTRGAPSTGSPLFANAVGNNAFRYGNKADGDSDTDFHMTETFRNTVNTYDLTITKSVLDSNNQAVGNASDYYKIYVDIDNVFGETGNNVTNYSGITISGSGLAGTAMGTEGSSGAEKGVIYIQGAGSVTISGIPAQTKVVVTEDTSAIISGTGATVNVNQSTGIATVTGTDVKDDYSTIGTVTNGTTNAISANVTVTIANTLDEVVPPTNYLAIKMQKKWQTSDDTSLETSVKFKIQSRLVGGTDDSWTDVSSTEYTLTNSDHSGSTSNPIIWETSVGKKTSATANTDFPEKDTNNVYYEYRILEWSDNGGGHWMTATGGYVSDSWKADYTEYSQSAANAVTSGSTGSEIYTLTLAIKNTPVETTTVGTPLPKTGARGVYAIVTFGAFAITIAGVALLIYRKKLQTVNIYAVKGSEKPKE